MKEHYLFEYLLDLYCSRTKESIRKELDSNIEELNNDKFLKELSNLESQFNEKLNNLNAKFMEEHGVYLIPDVPTDFVTIDSLKVLFSDKYNSYVESYRTKLSNLESTIEEVRAHLYTCTSREEGLKVLKDYGIINSKYKLN